MNPFKRKTEEEKYLKFLDNFRKKHVPPRYNQIHLLDELCNDEIDHYIDISNRSDGKTFNYLHFFIHLSIELGLPFILICRHYTVRMGYQRQVIKVLDKSGIYDSEEFLFARGDFYTTIHYKDKIVGIITDLNQATDLKYHSNFLEDFPILVYDEFLALEDDYLIDEWDRLKTIYSSVNRKDESEIPYIKFPKLFYLGNAVNFSSPILAELNIFSILESHVIDTQKQYDNVLLGMYKNNNANDERNLRAFREEKDNMTMGEFEVNNFAIATDNDFNKVKLNQYIINIKLNREYMQIKYNPDNLMIIIGVTSFVDKYHFNMKLKDNRIDSEYLNESFFKETHIKRYDRGLFKFENNFSRDLITDGFMDYRLLDILKIIRRYNLLNREESNFDKNERQYKDNYIDRTKKNLTKKFLL